MDAKKLKKINIKSFIKATNTSRLQSLRLPRDLSLGGSKVQPKKIYKPNVHAIRNKNKIEKSKMNEKLKAVNVIEKLEKAKERFVQSTGVFTEGIGPNMKLLTRPDNKKHYVKETKPSKKSELHVLTKELIINKPRVNDDIVKNDIKIDSDCEEKLPFVPSTWEKDNRLQMVKSEETILCNKLPTEYITKTDVTNPLLTMWQLPDSFASKGKKHQDFKLTDMPEGPIGKITVHKSGKYEVSIANTKLILDSTLDAFFEEVVYLDSDTKNCFVLGELTNKFILSPDWGILL